MLADNPEYSTDEWDLLLPHIMSVLRASPHRITGETANFLMLGREVRLPSTVTHDVTEDGLAFISEYAKNLAEKMTQAHDMLRKQQISARVEDTEEPSLFKAGDAVWLKSYRLNKGKSSKLQAKFVGPYLVVEALPYHTYRLRRNGKDTIQHEGRIKLHYSESTPIESILPRDGPRGADNSHVKPKPKAIKDRVTDNATNFSGGGVFAHPLPSDNLAIDEREYNNTLEITSLPDLQARQNVSTPLPIEDVKCNSDSTSEVKVAQKDVWGAIPQATTAVSSPDFPPLSGNQDWKPSRPGRMRSAPMHLKDRVGC